MRSGGSEGRGRGRGALAPFLAFALAIGTATAGDLVARNGTVYTNATMLRADLGGITIRHAGGICRVAVDAFEKLPPEIAAQLESARADAGRRRQDAADAEARQRQAEEALKARIADLQARKAAVEARLAEAKAQLGEGRSFAVIRKLDAARFPDLHVAPESRLYEIKFDDRTPAFLECTATRFVEAGQQRLWMKPKGSVQADLASGFDAVVAVYLETPPDQVAALDDAAREIAPIDAELRGIEADRQADAARRLAAMPCRACAASGKCAACAGTGVVRCPDCLATGRGAQTMEEKPCPTCHGTGQTVSALGVALPCTKCAHTGRLKASVTPLCSRCEGHGKILCPRCNGTRVCPECQGRGRGAATR